MRIFFGTCLGFTLLSALAVAIPVAADDMTFQREVLPTSNYLAMYDDDVALTDTSTSPGNKSVIWVNQPDSSDARLLSYFDISAIPTPATISQATLSYEFFGSEKEGVSS